MDCLSNMQLKVLRTGGVGLREVGLFERFWFIIHKFFVFARVYHSVGGAVLMILFVHNFGFFMAGFIGFLFAMQTLLREIVVNKQSKQLKNIYKKYMQILDESRGDIFDLKKVVKDGVEKNDKSTKVRLFLETLTSMFIIVAAVQNLLGPSRELPCITWHPVDTTIQPNNFIICMIQYLAVSSTLLMCVGQENVYLTLMRLQIAHAQYLIEHLKNINEIAGKQPKNAYSELSWWIRQHHQFLENGNVLRELFSPMLIITYSVVFSFVFAGAVSSIEPTYELQQKIVVNFFCIIYLWALYKFCSLADELHNTTLLLLRDSYHSNNIINGQSLAKASLLIQARCMKSHALSAYGFYPLCRESFHVLLKTTFSFVVSTMQIQNARAARKE